MVVGGRKKKEEGKEGLGGRRYRWKSRDKKKEGWSLSRARTFIWYLRKTSLIVRFLTNRRSLVRLVRAFYAKGVKWIGIASCRKVCRWHMMRHDDIKVERE